MAEYAVNLDAIGDIRLDAATQGGVFGALFPQRDKEICGEGDLVTKKQMETYMDYVLLYVKYVSTMDQSILNEHLRHLEETTGDIMKIQKALKKIQSHVGLHPEAQETEFDLTETTERLEAMKSHHQLMLQKTQEFQKLKEFASVEERVKKGIRQSVSDVKTEIKKAQPGTMEILGTVFTLLKKAGQDIENDSQAGDERRKKRRKGKPP